MKIVITVREYLNEHNGSWTDLCDLTGINPYAVMEGLMSADTEIVLTKEQAKELGVI